MSDMTPEEREAYENRLQAWRQAMIAKNANQNWIFSNHMDTPANDALLLQGLNSWARKNMFHDEEEDELEDSSPEPEKPKREIEAIEELEYDMLRWEIMNGSADKV